MVREQYATPGTSTRSAADRSVVGEGGALSAFLASRVGRSGSTGHVNQPLSLSGYSE